ncbi:hypothetical protein Nepgr_004247 [Nepenthes gracilis]|uniref:Bifunctional inhibitor/plant lipid transfer protein/seed storage helical domain-containing protein n=1 Tax=Nepenthes gracilis TaxID=150966 RepID=A0AAD3S100_NEPGR|nr:hypothetical protein Nepgr_004247 [Nepenthes gracilis]
MDGFRTCPHKIFRISVILLFCLSGSTAQVANLCTISMVNNFTPCLNFITGSSYNGTAPTSSCCSSLRSIMTSSMDCACLLLAANVPLLPINVNRSLAISLPQACKNGGVPLQCKASASPLPAPGPLSFGPTPPPAAASSPQGSLSFGPTPPPAVAFSPRVSKAFAPPRLLPASPPVEAEPPSTTPRLRPVLTSSSAATPSSTTTLPALALGFVVFLTLRLFIN